MNVFWFVIAVIANFLSHIFKQHFFFLFTVPSAPASFSFDLVQVTERHAELHWSDLTSLSPRLNFSFFEIFLMYQERKNSKSDQGDEHSCWKPEEKREAERFQSIVRNYISQNSTGKSVSGLSPGSIYSFSLQASHPSGLSWTLGQTQTAYTSESADSFSHKLYKKAP